MKKRIVTIALVIALLATCFAGTYAYLTDTDEAINVMTMGNVDIEQIEVERAANGGWNTFTPKKRALPAVGEIEWAADKVSVGGGSVKVFQNDLKNVVDKFVYVQNNGNTEAYVRTIVAMEAPNYDPTDLIHVNVNDDDYTQTPWTPIDINGVKFVYSVFTYKQVLLPGEATPTSLAQVFLDAKATNADCAAFGDTWEILVLSQAVQAAGWNNPDIALDEAFGDTTNANILNWFTAVIQ